MSKQPWMKFYPADWRADPRLHACSLAARGLWIECMALMHEAKPYGHLLVADHPVTEPLLAALSGASNREVSALLAELKAAGVCSRTRRGVIYSRRMVRDAARSEKARKSGKEGGNPILRKTTKNPDSNKGEEKGSLKLRGQKPDGRDSEHDTKATAYPSNSESHERAPPADAGADGDLDMQLYRRGKACLGERAGGMITRLKLVAGVGPALEIVDAASRKQAPREYVGGAIQRLESECKKRGPRRQAAAVIDDLLKLG